MKPTIITHNLELQFLGFRDLEWIDSITSSLSLHFYNKAGVVMIYTGHAHITPDAFVGRIMYGTKDTKPKDWYKVPATYELFFNLYESIEQELFLQLLHSWAKNINLTCSMTMEMNTWNESYDGSLEVCEHKCEEGWISYIRYEEGEVEKIY